MAGGKLFGGTRVGAVTLVEAPVSRSYAQKARVAFFAVTGAVALLADFRFPRCRPPGTTALEAPCSMIEFFVHRLGWRRRRSGRPRWSAYRS